MNYFVKITTDMKIEIIETEKYDWRFLAAQINCDYIEQATISSIITNPRFCFIVDEDGLMKSNRKINVLASSLYGYELYGDVLITRETINKHGFKDFTSLTKDMANRLYNMFTEIVKVYKEE
jgi:hypothetical protein